MASKSVDNRWATVTWEGARQVQLDIALNMTLRERLEAMEELSNLALRLAAMPRRHAKTTPSRAVKRKSRRYTATFVTS